MKKSVCIFVLALLLSSFVLQVGSAQAPDPDALKDDEVVQAVENIQAFRDQKKWELLSTEWRTRWLENEYVADFDSFMQKMNIVFVIFTGSDYSLSLTFFFVAFYFVFYFVILYMMISVSSPLSNGVSLLISLGLAVVMGHINILAITAEASFRLLFFRSGWYAWVSPLLLIMFLAFVFSGVSLFRKEMKKSHDAKNKFIQQHNQKILNQQVNAMMRGYGP